MSTSELHMRFPFGLGRILIVVALVLIPALIAFFGSDDDKQSHRSESLQSRTQEAPKKEQRETQKRTPKQEIVENTPASKGETSAPVEETRRRYSEARIELQPMLHGKVNYALLKLFNETNLYETVRSEESGGEGYLQQHHLYELSPGKYRSWIHGNTAAKEDFSVELGFWNHQFELPVKEVTEREGYLDLGKVSFDFAEHLPKHYVILHASLIHTSGRSLGSLNSNLGVKIKHKENQIAEDSLRPDANGELWMKFDRTSSHAANGKEFSDQEIKALTMQIGEKSLSCHSHAGSYFEFGSAAIGGALIEVFTQFEYQAPVAWPGTPQASGAMHVMREKDTKEVGISYVLKQGEDSYRGGAKSLGLGKFHTQMIVPAGDYSIRYFAEYLRYASDWIDHDETLEARDGHVHRLEMEIKAPPISVIHFEDPSGKAIDEVEIYRVASHQVESSRRFAEFETYQELDDAGGQWFSHYKTPYLAAHQNDQVAFIAITRKYRAKWLDLGDTPKVVTIRFDQRWNTYTPPERDSITVKIDLNGHEVPKGTRLTVRAYYDGATYYKSEMVEIDGEGPYEVTFYDFDQGREVVFKLQDLSGIYGFADIDVAEPVNHLVSSSKDEVTLTLRAPPVHPAAKDGLFLKATCAGKAVALRMRSYEFWMASAVGPDKGWYEMLASYDIPAEGRNATGAVLEKWVSKLLNGDSKELKGIAIVRKAPAAFEIQFPASAWISVPRAFAAKFPGATLSTSEMSMPIDGAGRQPIYAKDNYGDIVLRSSRGAKLWEGKLSYHDREHIPKSFAIKEVPTEVEFTGSTQGLRWNLKRSVGYSIAYDIKPGFVIGLHAGDYTLLGYDSENNFRAIEHFSVANGPAIQHSFPSGPDTFQAPKQCRVEFSLSKTQLELISEQGVDVKHLEVLPERAPLRYRHSFLNSAWKYCPFEPRIEDENTLILEFLMPEKPFWLYFTAGKERHTSGAVLIDVPKAEGDQAPPPLKRSFPKMTATDWNPSYDFDGDEVDEFRDVSDELFLEVYVDGKKLGRAAGLVVGKRNEVRVFLKDNKTNAPDATIYCNPESVDTHWEEGSREALAPLVEKLRAAKAD